MIQGGGGGGIVVWYDYRGLQADIYAQKVNSAVLSQWAADGVPLSKASGNQLYPRAVGDGAGGAIVVWQDGRGDSSSDIYAQRVNALGVTLWATGGVPICAAINPQRQPVVVADGMGGAVVAWVDDRALGSDVYVQRISPGGVAQWTANGVALCTATGVQQDLTIVTDGLRGAIVGWQDQRGGSGDIYARRVDENGVAQWTADGVALCAATGVQETPAAVADGTGGAIVGWADGRGANKDIYAQRVNGSGVAQWAADGVGLCAALGDQQTPAVSGDGVGGALVVWQDGRGANKDIYARRVDGAGVAQWAVDGVGVCTAAADQVGPAIAADPTGGAVVGWSDLRTGGNGTDIYAQHLNVAGAVQWTANGVQVCDALTAQDAAMVVPDGQGGAVLAWRDFRAGASPDLYSQRVSSSGQVASQCGTAAPPLLSASAVTAATGPQNYYTYDQVNFYWSGVGVRSAAGSDWDLEAYPPVTFGYAPYPTCFSTPLAGSFASSGVDLIVGDFNVGHTWPVTAGDGAGYGIRAFRYSGAGNGSVEWDDGTDEMSIDCGTGSGCGAVNTNFNTVLDVWDVFLGGNRNYTFTFTRTGAGTSDIRFLLFGDGGTTGTYFVPRSARLFELGAAGTWVFNPPRTAWYGVVLVNENGGTSNGYTVRAVTGVPATDVGEAPGAATGLRGVAPNPSAGRVQIQFALGEAGAVAFEVVDMAGRMVARIPGRRWEAGTWSVGWDGRTSRGTQAAPGIYFVQMRVDGRRVGLGRLALIR
jgi:hypothetical protein